MLEKDIVQDLIFDHSHPPNLDHPPQARMFLKDGSSSLKFMMGIDGN